MYSLGEVNFIQGMLDLGNCKNSVGLKPNAELRKDAKAPSIPKSELLINCLFISKLMKIMIFPIPDSVPMLYEGALASFLNSALGFSPTLFLGLPKSSIPCMKFTSLNCTYALKHIGFGHRCVSGFLSKGKHKVCPYIRS